MKHVDNSVVRVRQAVRFIKKFPTRLLKFKKCIVGAKIISKKLLCDTCTRWNSTYLMLEVALALEDAFERYCEEDPCYASELKDRDGKGKP